MRNLKKLSFALLLIVALAVFAVSFAACSDDNTGNNGDPPKLDIKYTVLYYDDDDTLLDTRVFNIGDDLTYPMPEREGYYTRWKYYDMNGNQLSDVDKVTDDIKLVAYYEIMDCLVSVIDSVTEETLYEQYYAYGDVYSPELDTSKPGYEFLGYRVDGETEYRESFPLTGTVAILAEYRAYEYTLTLKDDITDSVIGSSLVNYGELTLPSAPEKEGYKFDGWYMQINAIPTRVGGAGEKILITGNTVLWASYTKNTDEA